jgi:acyl carrier protein
MIAHEPTPEEVRLFLVKRYAAQLEAQGRRSEELPDNFDFLLEGIVDSFGILEMVSAVEKEFGIEIDMAGLEAEEMTLLGPFARYVAEQIGSKKNDLRADSSSS